MALPYSVVGRSAVSLIILTYIFDDCLILYIFCGISSGSTLFTKVSVSIWERSGSVVECLTRDREAAGSSLTGVTALWSLSKTNLS